VDIRAGDRGGAAVVSGFHIRWDLHAVQVIALGSPGYVGSVVVTGEVPVTHTTLALAPLFVLFVLFGPWDRYRRRAEAGRAVVAR
jgi:hypothetical protein